MADKAKVKMYAVNSRHSINLPTDLVRDSQFPFLAGEELVAHIEKGKLVIERSQK